METEKLISSKSQHYSTLPDSENIEKMDRCKVGIVTATFFASLAISALGIYFVADGLIGKNNYTKVGFGIGLTFAGLTGGFLNAFCCWGDILSNQKTITKLSDYETL